MLVLAVSSRGVFSLVNAGRTTVSPAPAWQIAQKTAGTILGENWPEQNPLRRAIVSYLNVSGIETGYGYFGPNVPYNYKLVFELHHPGGSVEYALPEVGGASAGKRLANLFDYIGHVSRADLREILIKMLAYSVWQNHPDVIRIRAVFGFVKLPTLEQFRRGEKESYETLYVYNLEFQPSSQSPDQ